MLGTCTLGPPCNTLIQESGDEAWFHPSKWRNRGGFPCLSTTFETALDVLDDSSSSSFSSNHRRECRRTQQMALGSSAPRPGTVAWPTCAPFAVARNVSFELSFLIKARADTRVERHKTRRRYMVERRRVVVTPLFAHKRMRCTHPLVHGRNRRCPSLCNAC